MRTRVLLLVGVLTYLTFIASVLTFAAHATLADALAEIVDASAPSETNTAIYVYLAGRIPTLTLLLFVPCLAALGLSVAILVKDCSRLD
jgi:hypothetical protein